MGSLGVSHFGMPRGAKMSLPFNGLHEIGCSSLKFKHYFRRMHRHKWKEIINFVQSMEDRSDQFPTKNVPLI